MVDPPVQTVLAFLGVIFLITGIFLVLAGNGVVRIEHIHVTKGRPAWLAGILLVVTGFICVFPEAREQFGGRLPGEGVTDEETNGEVAWLTLISKSPPDVELPDVAVYMDGKLVGSTGSIGHQEFPVPPGKHTFCFEKKGYETNDKKTLTLERGDRREKEVWLKKLASTAATPPCVGNPE